MNFEIIGDIEEVEVITSGRGIRDLSRLQRTYGKGKWRKMKGFASIRLQNDKIRRAELHWYEAHGIGRREIKRKQYIDEP